MTYVETIKFLYNLERFGIKLGLENISIILNLFDNPHKKFKSIHIAGTNGKGSTAAMTASILQYAGYKTGLYTSPHIQDFRERIMVNGAMIPEEDVVELTEIIRCKMQDPPISPLVKGGIKGGLTFFEFTTAMAFLHFSREMVDFAVVEVGLGGRLDATNVLNPVLSIITEIDIEHTDYLGEDIKSIAREKGGIIKDSGTVILSSNKTDVVEVIESICKDKKARLYRIGKDFIGERENTDIHSQHFNFIEMSLRGKAEAISHSFEIPL
ncbi:MAG: Mur ligase family protein, partial [Nitrospinota bacterium]